MPYKVGGEKLNGKVVICRVASLELLPYRNPIHLTSEDLGKDIVYVPLEYLSSQSERRGWNFLPKSGLRRSELLSVRSYLICLSKIEDSQDGWVDQDIYIIFIVDKALPLIILFNHLILTVIQ